MSVSIRCYFVVGTRQWNVTVFSSGSTISNLITKKCGMALKSMTRVSFSITDHSFATMRNRKRTPSDLTKLHSIVDHKYSSRNETIKKFQE